MGLVLLALGIIYPFCIFAETIVYGPAALRIIDNAKTTQKWNVIAMRNWSPCFHVEYMLYWGIMNRRKAPRHRTWTLIQLPIKNTKLWPIDYATLHYTLVTLHIDIITQRDVTPKRIPNKSSTILHEHRNCTIRLPTAGRDGALLDARISLTCLQLHWIAEIMKVQSRFHIAEVGRKILDFVQWGTTGAMFRNHSAWRITARTPGSKHLKSKLIWAP